MCVHQWSLFKRNDDSFEIKIHFSGTTDDPEITMFWLNNIQG